MLSIIIFAALIVLRKSLSALAAVRRRLPFVYSPRVQITAYIRLLDMSEHLMDYHIHEFSLNLLDYLHLYALPLHGPCGCRLFLSLSLYLDSFSSGNGLFLFATPLASLSSCLLSNSPIVA